MNFSLQQQFAVSPETLYTAWLDSETHSQMTDSEATASDEIGGHFSAWDGYIKGTNLALEPHEQIVQSWRTADFMEEDPDSMITVNFEMNNEGCLLTLTHENIPIDQPDYEEGWRDYYFKPMLAFFS